jgi:hypothetical protein
MRFATIRRARLAGGATVGKFGHSVAKYSKNPAVRHALNRSSCDRKVTPITHPFSSVEEALKKTR